MNQSQLKKAVARVTVETLALIQQRDFDLFKWRHSLTRSEQCCAVIADEKLA